MKIKTETKLNLKLEIEVSLTDLIDFFQKNEKNQFLFEDNKKIKEVLFKLEKKESLDSSEEVVLREAINCLLISQENKPNIVFGGRKFNPEVRWFEIPEDSVEEKDHYNDVFPYIEYE